VSRERRYRRGSPVGLGAFWANARASGLVVRGALIELVPHPTPAEVSGQDLHADQTGQEVRAALFEGVAGAQFVSLE